MKFLNKKNIILLISLMILILSIYVSTIGKTEYIMMYPEELKVMVHRLIFLKNNGYNTMDILDAYVDLIGLMVPNSDHINVKYARVKQRYVYKLKYGWVPADLPEMELYY